MAEWQAAAAAADGAPRPPHARTAAADASAPDGVVTPAPGADEAAYAEELAAELAGVPYSAADTRASGAKAAARVAAAPAARLEAEAPGSEAEAQALSHVLLPRKRKELYTAMQMSRAKKAQATNTLRERKQARKQQVE